MSKSTRDRQTNAQQEKISSWFKTSTIQIVAIDADDALWYDSRYFLRLEKAFEHLIQKEGIQLSFAELKLCIKPSRGEHGYASALVKIATDYKLNPQNMTRLQKEINRFENHPVELLPFARKALNQMKHFRKFLITKGNEQEQRRKLKLSSMSNLFDEILIVNKKNTKEIWKIFSDRNIAFDSTIFIGNSIQHDILPAVENGGRAALSRY